MSMVKEDNEHIYFPIHAIICSRYENHSPPSTTGAGNNRESERDNDLKGSPDGHSEEKTNVSANSRIHDL